MRIESPMRSQLSEITSQHGSVRLLVLSSSLLLFLKIIKLKTTEITKASFYKMDYLFICLETPSRSPVPVRHLVVCSYLCDLGDEKPAAWEGESRQPPPVPPTPLHLCPPGSLSAGHPEAVPSPAERKVTLPGQVPGPRPTPWLLPVCLPSARLIHGKALQGLLCSQSLGCSADGAAPPSRLRWPSS